MAKLKNFRGFKMCDEKFNLIIEFLKENPERLSYKKPCNLNDNSSLQLLYHKYSFARSTRLVLSEPSTIPDEAVSVLLQEYKFFSKAQTDRIKVEHQLSMAAENLVGALLERYIADVLEPYGWVWCAGDFVRAIDFIKKDQSTGLWQAVQVKNRDNTENSSSSAIRNGTEIDKWFRTYSRPSKTRSHNTNWHAFPEKKIGHNLSEEGFLQFIRDYIRPPTQF